MKHLTIFTTLSKGRLFSPPALGILLLFCLLGATLGHTREIAWDPTDTALAPGIDDPLAMTTADLDNDGDKDLVVIDHLNDLVIWYDNPGFTPNTISATEVDPHDVETADINGDGNIDVITVSEDNDRIVVWLNSGGSPISFAPVIVTEDVNGIAILPNGLLDGAQTVSVADMDGDGDLDLIGTGREEDIVAWFENDGAATPDFTVSGPHVITRDPDGTGVGVEGPADAVNGAIAFDADRDGDLDVAIISSANNTLSLWKNQGGGPTDFTEIILSNTQSFPFEVTVSDLNRDGILDLAVTYIGNDTVAWYENDGASTPTLTERIISTTAGDPGSIQARDLDLDGDDDLLVTASDPQQIQWYENTAGDATAWTNRVAAPGALIPTTAIFADMDNDGDDEILFGSLASTSVNQRENLTIHRSGYFPELPGDIIVNPVDASFGQAAELKIADLNRDGTPDVVGVSQASQELAWWSNNGFGVFGAANTITSGGLNLGSLEPADLDGDGDLDVIVGAENPSNGLFWWENTTGDASTWTSNTISLTNLGTPEVISGDIDGDGDVDVAITTGANNIVYWYENSAGDGSAWTQNVVANGLGTPVDLQILDSDNDGDLDLACATQGGNTLFVFENRVGDGSLWGPVIVSPTFASPTAVGVGDLNGDGETDVIASGTAGGGQNISWWNNNGGAWTEVVVDSDGGEGFADLAVVDFDQDGDLDIVASDINNSELEWWENTDGVGGAWQAFTLDSSFNFGRALTTGDLDRDGDNDILAASFTDNNVDWYENVGGQNRFATTPSNLPYHPDGIERQVFEITMTHRGRTGDLNSELHEVEMQLDNGTGAVGSTPLTNAQVADFIQNVFVYADDGSGVFDAADIQVSTLPGTPTVDVQGRTRIPIADPFAPAVVAFGTPRLFFVTVASTATPGPSAPAQYRATHVTEFSSTAENQTFDIPLANEFAVNTSTNAIPRGAPFEVLVDLNAPGPADGLSWSTAWPTIQQGIDMATSFGLTEIWVAGGPGGGNTYTPAATLLPLSNYELYGGFEGFLGIQETLRSQRDFANNATIIDGQSSIGPIVSVPVSVTNMRLDGFTVQNGNNTAGAGGAMQFDQGNGVIENCILTLNSASSGGGAIALNRSDASISNCQFIENQSFSTGGGAILVSNAQPTITGSLFRGNNATPGGGHGGGILIQGALSLPRIANSRFIENFARHGAGLASFSVPGAWTLDVCEFAGNFASLSGGGMFIDASFPVMNRVEMAGNVTNVDGGAIAFNNANGGTYSNFQVSGNLADLNGGGIAMAGVSNPTLTHFTFVDNQAGIGDGDSIYLNGTSNGRVYNSIFVSHVGHAIWENTASNDPLLENCLFFNSGIADIRDEGTTDVTGAANINALINFTTATNSGTLDQDPLFVGGATGTWTINPVYNPVTNTTTLTDAAASFPVDALRFQYIQTNLNAELHAVIVSNTATTIEVIGDVSGFTISGNTYQFIDYRLAACSPAIDAGSVTFPASDDLVGTGRPIDVTNLGADATGTEFDLGALESTLSAGTVNLLTSTTLDFGQQDVALGPTAPLNTTLENIATSPLTIVSVAISGADAGEFVLGATPTTILPCDTADFPVQFDPTTEGTKNATLRILTDNGLFLVSLTGFGTLESLRVVVDKNAPGPIFDGITWQTAFRDIQTGINTAVGKGVSEVWVAGNVGSGNGNRYLIGTSIQMASDVEVYGGFEGFLGIQESMLTQRDFTANTTIIDGATTVAINVSYGAGLQNSRLDGFTVTNANSTVLGGGVVFNQTFTGNVLANSIVENNAGGSGGGIYFDDSTGLITNCSINDNQSNLGNGGGIHIRGDANLGINNTSIFDNVAVPTSGLNGGGISIESGNAVVTVQNSFIFNNRAFNGGGIWVNAPFNFQLNDVRVANNVATGDGGGAYFIDFNARIDEGGFVGNSAQGFGGGVYLSNSDTVIVNNITSANFAGSGGGGLYAVLDSDAQIQNCTYAANETPGGTNGGGVLADDTSGLDLRNTIFFNHSDYAIAETVGLTQSPLVENCLFDTNFPRDYLDGGLTPVAGAAAIDALINYTAAANANNVDGSVTFPTFVTPPLTGTWTSVSYNAILDRTILTDSGAAFTTTSLRLAFVRPDNTDHFESIITAISGTTMAVPGDLTAFVTAGDTYELVDYQLMGCSPAIDNGGPINAPAFDRIGVARPVDVLNTGADGTGTEFDIGAFEAEANVVDVVSQTLALAFGDQDVPAGPTAALNATIQNLGTTSVQITGASISGPDAAEFSAGSPIVVLLPCDTLNIPVTFDPVTEGNKTASLDVTYTTGTISIPLTGRGLEHPFVVSINRRSTSPTNQQLVEWVVTFNETVTGVDLSDFALTLTDLGVPTPASLISIIPAAGPADQYIVLADRGDINGPAPEIRLDLIDDDSILDTFLSLPLEDGIGGADGSFRGQTYLIDETPPTAIFTLIDPNPTALDVVRIDVDFNEPVAPTFTNDDITVVGTIPGLATSATVGDPADPNYRTALTMADPNADGLIGIDVLGNARITTGLLALYTFEEGVGDLVRDVSGFGAPLDLTIEDPFNTRWINGGGLEVFDSTIIEAAGPSPKLITNMQASQEFTIEAYVQPASTGQAGPARIVTYSEDNSDRNFALMQESDDYRSRIRSNNPTVDNNGFPEVATGNVTATALQHVVLTRSATGLVRIYVDGVIEAEQQDTLPVGDFSNWDPNYVFALANERNFSDLNARDWRGIYYQVAVYDRALDQDEVNQNRDASQFVRDLAGNDYAGGSSPQYIIDNGPPQLLSITRADRNPTNETFVNFTVTFSEAVENVDTATFTNFTTVPGGGVAGESIVSITPLSGPSIEWTVTVNTGAGDGTLGLNFVNAGAIQDPLLTTPLATVPPLVGEVYDIDKTPPTALLAMIPPIITNNDTVQFTVDFNEPVFPFFIDDSLGVTGTLALGATKAVAPNPTDPNYLVDVSPFDPNADGTVGIEIPGTNTPTTTSLIALYEFDEGTGNQLNDTSGFGTPLNMTIQDPGNTTWLTGGGLRIDSSTFIASNAPGTKIFNAVQITNEITVEAFIRPANNTSTGPDRIVTMSDGTSDRNFTLGQEGDEYEFRLRTTTNNNNGSAPELNAFGLFPDYQHVI